MSDSDLLSRVIELEQQLAKIADRNQRVESNKAWEGSRTRILFIMAITYLLVAIVFYISAVPDYYFNALIPTLGFYLSTQSLPVVKRLWLKRFRA